jgi:hypothetical protein
MGWGVDELWGKKALPNVEKLFYLLDCQFCRNLLILKLFLAFFHAQKVAWF